MTGMTTAERHVAERLRVLWEDVIGRAESSAAGLPGYEHDRLISRDNLLSYASLRDHNIGELQLELSDLGLSSLGRLEGQVLHSLCQVLGRLGAPAAMTRLSAPNRVEASAILGERARALLGRPRLGRLGRIMVTLDATSAADPGLVEGLLLAGMDLVRINCAHDDPAGWESIVEAVRAAEARLSGRGAAVGRRCHVSMDLGGPRLRTGPMPLVPGPVRLVVDHQAEQPLRGRIDARATRTCALEGDGGHSFVLAVPGAALASLRPGEVLTFADARGRDRQLAVVELCAESAVVELSRTAIVGDGTCILREDGTALGDVTGTVARLDLRLMAGDSLILSKRADLTAAPGAVPVSLPRALEGVEVGHRVFIDGGRVAAEVVLGSAEALALRVLAPTDTPVRLRAEKGLNFPDSKLGLAALTDDDRAALPFVVKHADVVGMSFVHRPEDIDDLRAELRRLGRPEIGVVAKIETAEAVYNLVRILLAGLTLPNFGVMIARGDLAVEVGFENLAFVQEDILCLCEAAHVPVIWATQVLESLARTGLPDRAEITDATMSQRAECVMLNKGPHILEAVRILSLLLGTADRHRTKKREVFREFTVQRGVLEHSSEEGLGEGV